MTILIRIRSTVHDYQVGLVGVATMVLAVALFAMPWVSDWPRLVCPVAILAFVFGRTMTDQPRQTLRTFFAEVADDQVTGDPALAAVAPR